MHTNTEAAMLSMAVSTSEAAFGVRVLKFLLFEVSKLHKNIIVGRYNFHTRIHIDHHGNADD